MIDLEAIRERLEKATPGPWRHETRGGAGNSIYGPTETHYFEGHDGYRPLATAQECTASSKFDEQRANQQANIDLIAHAPTDIKALVEEVERLRKIEANMPDYVLAMEEATMLRQRVMGGPRCASCQGQGSHPLGSSWVPCDACNGKGY